MSLKISLALLIVSCFLTFAYGKYPPTYENTLPYGTGKSFKEFTYEIEKSFKELTKNWEWIYHLVPIVKSGLEKGFETITTWPLDLALRVEFLTMANGSHFVFPVSEDYEKEKHYKTVAIAVSNIWMNLQTMERVDKVLRNVTKIVLSKDNGQEHYRDHEKSYEKILGALLREYFEILHYQMRNDAVLHGEFRKRMEEAREYVERYPEMREPLDEIWNKGVSETKYADVGEIKTYFYDKEIFHRGIANKVFLKKSVNHFSMYFRPEQHKRYLLARAMIQKAVDSIHYGGESKINDMYQQTLVKVWEVAKNGDLNTIREHLFNYLVEALESDPSLYNEVKIVMKQVEKTSMYDSDMFIDFSIL